MLAQDTDENLEECGLTGPFPCLTEDGTRVENAVELAQETLMPGENAEGEQAENAPQAPETPETPAEPAAPAPKVRRFRWWTGRSRICSGASKS